ncbi:hypothetical protein [Aeromicrobium endophyticum]|uniref:hypothetical protein n=1 Tax=Aeromicrobium endophyticum TaxID=2292704 RepID=UPI001314FDCF|nr:hypothetical protein [Aeromicrobium endophyticum]
MTGKLEPHAASLGFDDDGMSVHSEARRADSEVPRDAICDWDTHHAIEFPVVSVQPELARVVISPGDDPVDKRLNEAHALVQGLDKPKPGKVQRAEIRDGIIDSYRWVAEDPNCPE